MKESGLEGERDETEGVFFSFFLFDKAFRLPLFFREEKWGKKRPTNSVTDFLFLFFLSHSSLCDSMASPPTPPPWRLKIVTSLETRLLVALEAPAATVGELRGERE